MLINFFVFFSRDKFVMEYCGEVCSLEEFEERKKVYSMEKRRHYYFMSLKADDVGYKLRNILLF